MRRQHDVAILGGGPAGIACALRAADEGLSVLLCDPQAGSFDKPCGEGILPAGVQELRELGISSAGTARPFAGIRYCVPGAGDLNMDLESPGEAWWRTDLHAALENALLRRPSVLRLNVRAEALPQDDGFLIQAGGATFHARHLVAADGAGGRAASWLRPAARGSTQARAGVRARFEESRRLDRVEVHFGGGYDVYLTPLPRGAINVVVLADFPCGSVPDAAELLAAGLARHPRAAVRLGQQLGRAESRALGLPWPRRLTDGRAFLVGDAGGAVDPILGAGMTVALRTGAQAAQALVSLQHGAAPADAARAFQRAGRSERRARHMLASSLRLVSRHDFLARQLARTLRLAPGLARHMAGIAAGVNRQPLPAGA
jgi:flavin-dependent dehydrogenase